MCMFRECLGAARNLILKANNSDDDTVASFYRSMTCSRGCCCTCCPPFMAVNSPPYIRLGAITERYILILYICIITLLPFFIEMLQYDWL